MTTLAALTEECYGKLYGLAQAERPEEDTPASSVSGTGDVSWTWTTPTMWKRGDYAEDATDGEIVYIAVDGGTTVRRAQRGTTAAAAYDTADVFYRNPMFPRIEIERAITQVVRNDLWPHVWTWHHDTLSFVSGQTTYPLDQYVEDVVRVSQYNLDGVGKWYPLSVKAWDVERQINTAVSTNSNMLRLIRVYDETEPVYYTAKRRPHISDLGNLSDEIAEMIPWAVVGKLSAALRAVPRRQRPGTDVNQQSEGSEFRDYRGFMAEFLRMRDALHRQLLLDVPPAPRFRKRERRRAF
jgi:hypothetical protein